MNDYEMTIKRTVAKKAKCKACGYRSKEMYLFKRHGEVAPYAGNV